jgi:hypothetical protein
LVLIGTHNGQKTQKLVSQALHYGKICLIEPTPYLFDALRKLYQQNEHMVLLNFEVNSDPDEVVKFFMQKNQLILAIQEKPLNSLSGESNLVMTIHCYICTNN